MYGPVDASVFTKTFDTYYVAISVLLVASVATVMWRNGRLFLSYAFGENLRLARSVNRSLLLAFVLIMAGQIALANGPWGDTSILNGSNLFPFLLGKIGWQLVMLGVLYLVNLLILSRIRLGTQNRAKEARNGESILA